MVVEPRRKKDDVWMVGVGIERQASRMVILWTDMQPLRTVCIFVLYERIHAVVTAISRRLLAAGSRDGTGHVWEA
jgi:hypothetical protein